MTIKSDEASSVEDMREKYIEYYGAEQAEKLITALKAMETLDVELSVSAVFTALNQVITNPDNSAELVNHILEDLSSMLTDALGARVDDTIQQENQEHQNTQ